ncbi:gem nuclear organelle associated protein rigor mortis [Rhodnius prolixus]
MGEITIPPSPSWYLSNILACNDEGTAVAYGAKHELVILRPTTNFVKQCEIQPVFIPMAHKERVSAIAFSPSSSENFKNHLVSCSDDGTVHVWDWLNQSLILSHSGHQDGHKIVGVDWSRANPNLIVSITDLGNIVCWDLLSNTIKRLFVGSKILPLCISCCPHNKDIIAVGAKAGLIAIYNIKGAQLAFRLRGHELDVISLAWCPVPQNVFKDDNSENTLLLASGSKDRTIYFWRAGTDGRYETFINLPNHPVASAGYRSKNGVGGQGNSWVCVRWPEPHTFVSSSLYGELLCYDLKNIIVGKADGNKKTKNNKVAFRLVHGNHTKGLFSIAIPYFAAKNHDDRLVWSYALDKHLIACKLEASKVVVDFTTIGGIVYCMAASPLDPNRVAIGTGDNKILVWNMSNDSSDDIVTHWNKINSKVMAIAWHPTNESVLAFGTGEGRVGLFDTSSSKPALLLRLYHRKSVYSLIWAPPVGNIETFTKKKPLALFSVGDGEILQYNPDNPEKDPISLASFFIKCDASAMVSKAPGRSDLAWKFDMSLAAIGNDNGVLYIVDGRTFSHIHTVFAHKKLIQCVVWHPGSVTSENAVSPYSSWLATASDNIQIINVTNEGVETIACLNTHSEKVVSLCWSPHFNARLISASYDYTSQVWDVASGSVLACFDGHHSAVVCCLPSTLHQDYIITGSADNTVRVWNINKYHLTKSKTKKQRLTGVMKKFAGVQEATDLTPAEDNEQIISNPLPIPSKPEIPIKQEVITENKRKSKSMFPVTSNGISQAKSLRLLWDRITGNEPPVVTDANAAYLNFFGDSKAIRQLMTAEESQHRQIGNHTYSRHLSLWSGDISETIKEACRKKQLDDWLVSLAPLVSHKLWVDCCKSYASQLAEKGDIYKAVSYLLSTHQLEEAIDLLLDSKMFREAVLLAKSRLPNEDVTIKKIMGQWASHCIGTGMFPLAAHCLLSNGSNIEAVEVLSRVKDPATLALAAEIAQKSEASEMAVSIALRALHASLERKDFVTAKLITTQHPAIKDLEFWIEVYCLMNEWEVVSYEKGLSWICGKNVIEKCTSLLEKAEEVFKKKSSSHSVLLKYIPNKSTSDSEFEVMLYVSGQICLSVTAQHQLNNSKCVLKHLIHALEAAYSYHIHNPASPNIFLQISCWISPNGPLSNLSWYNEDEKSLSESCRTFLACSGIYWFDLLNTKSLLPLEDDVSINLVYDSIKQFSILLFHKEVISHHKLDIELKKLENTIAASKLKALKSMKYCKEIEAQLRTQTCTNGTVENEHNSSDQESKSQKENDSNEEYNEEETVKKLTKIKSIKLKFEEERIAVPNPFIAYCSLRNILQSLINKNSKGSEDTLKEITKLWEKASVNE